MACDLQLISVTPTAPTSIGGRGYVTVVYATSSHTPAYVQAVNRATNGLYANPAQDTTDDKTGVLYNLPVGDYDLVVGSGDDPTCKVTGSFSIPAYQAIDTSLADAPRWEPVGGVLPNPVLLKVEAALLTAGVARVGLHVEVELWRPEAAAAFATFRATVRTATQYVDAAPYLRSELVALQRYARSSMRTSACTSSTTTAWSMLQEPNPGRHAPASATPYWQPYPVLRIRWRPTWPMARARWPASSRMARACSSWATRWK